MQNLPQELEDTEIQEREEAAMPWGVLTEVTFC